ncbi:hypothetical protein GPECTOR_1089g366 [Gonium pectorale]|uniref:DDE Tnp4 domain-containing protein n=1 Tax=Gonium pectorale TaxID=33097 RepID=A0A150FVB6_GONPE|nr:hypothetical protein GPECTOR_1089g366 [Gonium pectorale]|eukprot:KXZ40970.1 hypothetical protein GPECTOR_1089g366 [Gonium pectorale]
MGIGALVCRHGFVTAMCSMQTDENFLYFELLLEHALPKIQVPSLKAVFMDVACKFEGFWRGRHGQGPFTNLTFAIGPWHIRPHKPECNIRYNSRYIGGLGLTYGDLIEHLWADIRRHWFITAYMSPAARQDFITQLVRFRHRKKEEGLARQLGKWAQTAIKQKETIIKRYDRTKVLCMLVDT